ncbi:hypothetical protein M5K25_014988 [Dendrobium thyrsiflorum]|uniref:Uncharacterized protein n=1 Tax=Dendrobium thyrsiflorum TaxID=117978 RepID=A0ABD0UPW2_DENTH
MKVVADGDRRWWPAVVAGGGRRWWSAVAEVVVGAIISHKSRNPSKFDALGDCRNGEDKKVNACAKMKGTTRERKTDVSGFKSSIQLLWLASPRRRNDKKSKKCTVPASIVTLRSTGSPGCINEGDERLVWSTLLLSSPRASTYFSRQACMADPEVDHGFIFDNQGRTDILRSPFFDVFFSHDETANDYIDRILYQLSLSIEEHIRPGRWIIVGHPPLPHPPTTIPPTKVFGFIFVVIISILVWFKRPETQLNRNLILTEASSIANALEEFTTRSIFHDNSQMCWSQDHLYDGSLRRTR